MEISDVERIEMELLVAGKGNWSLYYSPKFNSVLSLANKNSRAADSIFGSINYFRSWLKNEIKISPNVKENITTEGYRIFTDNQKK